MYAQCFKNYFWQRLLFLRKLCTPELAVMSQAILAQALPCNVIKETERVSRKKIEVAKYAISHLLKIGNTKGRWKYFPLMQPPVGKNN